MSNCVFCERIARGEYDDAVARFERTIDDFAKHMIWASEHVKSTVVTTATSSSRKPTKTKQERPNQSSTKSEGE